MFIGAQHGTAIVTEARETIQHILLVIAIAQQEKESQTGTTLHLLALALATIHATGIAQVHLPHLQIALAPHLLTPPIIVKSIDCLQLVLLN
jgi:hypothetical protein